MQTPKPKQQPQDSITAAAQNPFEDQQSSGNPFEDEAAGDPAFGWGKNFANAAPDNTAPSFSNGFQGLKDALSSLGKGVVHGASMGLAGDDPAPAVPEGYEVGEGVGSMLPLGGGLKLGGRLAELTGHLPQIVKQAASHSVRGGLPGAIVGYKEGGLPGAAAGWMLGGSLGKALTAYAGRAAAPVEQVAGRAGRAVDYNKLLSTGMDAAGADAARVASGKTAMQTGIEALTPRAPSPMGMSDAFNAAGAAGRDASMGQAKMAQGIAGASVQPPVPALGASKAAGSMGGYGTGKGSGMAAVGGALLSPEAQPGASAPALSSNLPEAKNLVLEALGQPREALYQMLSSRYDPATTKFAMAGLPNRLPQ